MKNDLILSTLALLMLGLLLTLTPARAQTPAAQPEPDAPLTEPAPATEEASPPGTPPPAPSPPSDGLVRLNFRGAPLDMVLDHLSEAAGFIILKETDVEGTVDVWSNQPLNQDEAVDLLNAVLFQNGYAAIRQGRMLRIVGRDEAKRRDIPVRSGRDPEAIPRTDEMVTQIIPVRYANALLLTQDLTPLLPSYATLTANESGNALVLTDTQANIRRMAEIVAALDTSIASISTIRVFPLRYADAKQLAEAVKALFEAPEDNNRGRGRDRREEFFARFRGGGDRGEDNGPVATGTSVARQAASRVVAMPDERINALIVAAPDEYIPSIEQLVREIDVSVADITELRVFPLRNSDPVEMAQLLDELFSDEGEENQGGEVRFRGPFPFDRGRDRGGRNNNEPDTSERMKKQSQVVSVADPRTSSLIVSAASTLMPQIADMIEQLDSSSARKQKVYVYPLENADVTQVEQILRDMFERGNMQGNRARSTANQNSALSNRQQNQNTLGNSGFNNSGFGGGGLGTGGGGGGQTFR